MISTLLIVLIALVLVAYVAIPLLFPSQADPLPNLRDPVEQDLEEERDALFRAIRELDAREDLSEVRRAELRARYEAKAAKVLRALDERQAALRGAGAPRRTAAGARRFPMGALLLLGLMVVSASLLGGYVLPRVGQNGTVTTFDQESLEAGRALKELQQAAERAPTAENLLALGDAYWQLGDAEAARETYLRVTQEIDPVPALAYRRLGFLALQSDLGQAQRYLEQARTADPNDLDTLYTLAEVYFAQGQVAQAIDSWERYLATPGGAGDETALARLELARAVAPLAEAAAENPSEANLLAYADALWERGEREHAVSLYFRILTEMNPEQPAALSRVGQLLFFSGRTADAITVLERARAADGQRLETLLFLGNAYFSSEQYAQAIDAWEDYVAAAGGPEKAGRVPGLIEDARARMAGAAPESGPAPGEEGAARQIAGEVSGAAIFAANCSSCHGAAGEGGVGPRLAGNPRLADPAFVRDTVLNGRGMMPAFEGRLSEAELQALIAYLADTLYPSGRVGSR